MKTNKQTPQISKLEKGLWGKKKWLGIVTHIKEQLTASYAVNSRKILGMSANAS